MTRDSRGQALALGALLWILTAVGGGVSLAQPTDDEPVKGINYLVLLDISGSMEVNGNLERAAELGEGLLKPVLDRAATNLLFITFDNMPYDWQPGKQWFTETPTAKEFGETMRAAAVPGEGKGTEREWAMARGLRKLEQFVKKLGDEGKPYADYANLVLVVTDIDSDPRSYVRGDESQADEDFWAQVSREGRLQSIRTDKLNNGNLLLRSYRYTLEGQAPGAAETAASEEALSDAMGSVEAALQAIFPETPEAEAAARLASDLREGGLIVESIEAAPDPEDSLAQIVTVTLTSSYTLHWAVADLKVAATARAGEAELPEPRIAAVDGAGGLEAVVLSPESKDDDGNLTRVQTTIKFQVTVLPEPAAGAAPETRACDVELAVDQALLFDIDPSHETKAWRELYGAEPHERGLEGTTTVSFEVEAVAPPTSFPADEEASEGGLRPLHWALIGLAAVVFVLGCAYMVKRSKRKVPLGLQAASTQATFFIRMSRESRFVIGGSFSSLTLGEPFDSLTDSAAEVTLGAGRTPVVRPREKVTLTDAAGIEHTELPLVGEGSFYLKAVNEQDTVVEVQVSYAPESFGMSGGLTDGPDLTTGAYDNDLLS